MRSSMNFLRRSKGERTIWLDNARPRPLQVSITQPAITCDDLATIEQPTLVPRGEHADLFYESVTDTMAQCQPQAELQVLPGANHDGTYNAVEAFTAAILDFLADR